MKHLKINTNIQRRFRLLYQALSHLKQIISLRVNFTDAYSDGITGSEFNGTLICTVPSRMQSVLLVG